MWDLTIVTGDKLVSDFDDKYKVHSMFIVSSKGVAGTTSK